MPNVLITVSLMCGNKGSPAGSTSKVTRGMFERFVQARDRKKGYDSVGDVRTTKTLTGTESSTG
jgi:hypothetical protein